MNSAETLIMQVLVAALVGSAIILHRRDRRTSRQSQAAAAPPPSPSHLYVLASALYRPYEESAHPSDLTGRAELQAGAAQLAEGPYTTQDLLAYYSGDNAIIAIMALEALTRRDDDADLRHEILAVISSVAAWTRWFALRLLDARTPADRPVIGALLLKTDPTWTSRLCFQFLQEFVSKRLAGGEVPSFEDGFKNLSEEHGEFVQQLLLRLDDPRLEPLATQLDHWRRTRIDAAFLESVGRLWKVDDAADEPPPVEHEALRRHVQALEAALTEREPRSILVVGESGVGKSAIVRALGRRLQQHGWVVFEAGGGDLIAGQVFIGSLEERLRKLVQQIGGQRRVLWYVPEFHGLYWAGRSMHNETSALDYLLPHLEQGRILMIGETHPAAYERLVTLKPRCVTALEARRVEPLPTEATLALARDWARLHTPSQGPDLLPEATLREALHLAQQYLGDQAAPGSLLKFLDTTRRRLVGGAHAGPSGAIQVDDLIVTLTQLTGLPESILDDRHNLDLDALRRLFERRVLGQPEAAACLVDRVAMIKAGLTDPTRPQGVFLFAGPTGTGKTEIAKTLAEFLFGSAGRMIRIDMSEMESPDSLHRLLGSVDGRMQGALVDQIRRQPFSVVLLDEFEKAHPNVWDLFLQVFDDGRLTDRMGNTADFRQAIVIMTSNLGGRITSGAAPGFVHDGAPFRAADIERAIGQAFRPEFLNRIDRVVVFHPLGRETMREILHKELDEVTRRRGLRSRSWAIEWDDDAIEFLLAKGFTPDLGARPLKRAIERYLLSPLAVTIVDHQFPEGDQFLFVRAEGDRLVVEFVDPDASQEPAAAGAGPEARPAIDDEAAGEPLEVAAIAFDPRGTSPEIASLRRHYDRIADEVQAGTWQANKQALLETTSTPGFWTSPEGFGVLGAAEYRDRI
jgi:ATP-dependent Clp protease ATP-binding subunit ClpC